MKPTRRQFAVAGSISLSSLSGCVGVLIGGDSNGEEEPSQSESNTDSSPPEADENENENEGDANEENSASGAQEVVVRSDEIRSYLSWVESNYDQAITQYFQTVDNIDEQLENLQEKNINEIAPDDVTPIADDLRAAAQTTDSLIGQYYSVRYNFGSVASQIENHLQPSLRRQEYESAAETLNDIERKISLQTVSRTILFWFPRYVVFRAPYTRYYNTDAAEGNKIFESYISTSRGKSAALYAAPGQMNIDQSPFGERQESELFEWSKNHPRNTDLINISNWFQSNESQSTTYINILDYNLKDSSYPGNFVASEPDTSRNTLRNLDIPNFNDAPHLSVCLQEFQDSSTAESAFDEIKSTSSQSGEITHGGITYQKLFYIDESVGETYYADITNIDNYLVAVDVSSTQWQDRPTYSQISGSSRTEHLLADTWLIPSSG